MICASSHTQDVIPPADVLIVQVNWAAKALVVQPQKAICAIRITTEFKNVSTTWWVHEKDLPLSTLSKPKALAKSTPVFVRTAREMVVVVMKTKMFMAWKVVLSVKSKNDTMMKRIIHKRNLLSPMKQIKSVQSPPVHDQYFEN